MYSFLKNTSDCQAIPDLVDVFHNGSRSVVLGIQSNLYTWEIVLIMVGLGIFTASVAKSFTLIRSRIYKDKDSLDTDFDAGGQISVWLAATTIVSQWTWAATLLQSSTVASKYGISGPFWYAAGATIQILLFALISIQLKIHAPGAKTFLQVIRTRFGKKTHVIYCVFALITNVIVTSMLMLGGTAVMTSLVKGLSIELATAMVVAVMGTYTFIGCLGATFYVSYFNTTIIFSIILVFLVKVYHDDNEENPLGSLERVYVFLNCGIGPEGNTDNSFVTMQSFPAFMFGIINMIGRFGTMVVDQSYWQKSVATKPRESIWGFMSGGLVWFAVPFTFATTMGLAYLSLSVREGQLLLTDHQVNEGLVAPLVAQRLMGKTGELIVIILLLMAVTSTGASEIIAVTSILVYDVYQLYVKPFRKDHDVQTCTLCGKLKPRFAKAQGSKDGCNCISMTFCADCEKDDTIRKLCEDAIKTEYSCQTHGKYRAYNDYLARMKNWCVVWVSISVIPLTLILNALMVSLAWVYLVMGVVIGSAVAPISMAIFWARVTAPAMIGGAVGGTTCGLIAWLITASTYEGGLGDFMLNTGREVPMLVGNLVSMSLGASVTIIISLVTNRNFTAEKSQEVWEMTRDIDNPLIPWTEKYDGDLKNKDPENPHERPALQRVEQTYRNAKRIAYVGSFTLIIVLLVVWPGISIPFGLFSLTEFTHWINVSQSWGIIASIFIIIMPLIYEGIEVRKAVRIALKRKKTELTQSDVKSSSNPDNIPLNGTVELSDIKDG